MGLRPTHGDEDRWVAATLLSHAAAS